MVKVITDGDVEVYDSQGNLRMSLHGQQVLSVSEHGLRLMETAKEFLMKENGAKVKIDPEKIENAKIKNVDCPFTCQGSECGKGQ